MIQDRLERDLLLARESYTAGGEVLLGYRPCFLQSHHQLPILIISSHTGGKILAIEENKAVFRTMGNGVVLVSVALLLLLVSCASQQPKDQSPQVLLILREYVTSNVTGKQYLVADEPLTMKNMLEEAGFKVVIASASVHTFYREGITLETDVRLAKVKVSDYVGFIIPCMELGNWIVKPEEVAIAKRAVLSGKPVAAQHKGVLILSEAGVLEGKRHAFDTGQGIYIKEGKEYIVRDGNIITSERCPYWGSRQQTAELTQTLIAALRE